MNVVCVRVAPSVGPRWAPTTCSSNQGIAPGATKLASLGDATVLPHTALVSNELCQVARGVPFSNGFGLRKWVMICCCKSPCIALMLANNVACGEKKVQENPDEEGRQI